MNESATADARLSRSPASLPIGGSERGTEKQRREKEEGKTISEGKREQKGLRMALTHNHDPVVGAVVPQSRQEVLLRDARGSTSSTTLARRNNLLPPPSSSPEQDVPCSASSTRSSVHAPYSALPLSGLPAPFRNRVMGGRRECVGGRTKACRWRWRVLWALRKLMGAAQPIAW